MFSISLPHILSVVTQQKTQVSLYFVPSLLSRGVPAPNIRDSGPYWGAQDISSNLLKSFESARSLGQSFHRQGAGQQGGQKDDHHIAVARSPSTLFALLSWTSMPMSWYRTIMCSIQTSATWMVHTEPHPDLQGTAHYLNP